MEPDTTGSEPDFGRRSCRPGPLQTSPNFIIYVFRLSSLIPAVPPAFIRTELPDPKGSVYMPGELLHS
jgi:hypothetical protein